MATKPPAPDDRKKVVADLLAPEVAEKFEPDHPEAHRLEKKLPPPSDDDDEQDDAELELEDDEEDEDLVVFTAKQAAGALATIYAFIKPILRNYK